MVDFPKCVGCGYCCLTVMCWIGMLEYGLQKKCPALTWSNTDCRYYCQLATDDPEIAIKLHVGEGCASSLNTWRKGVKQR